MRSDVTVMTVITTFPVMTLQIYLQNILFCPACFRTLINLRLPGYHILDPKYILCTVRFWDAANLYTISCVNSHFHYPHNNKPGALFITVDVSRLKSNDTQHIETVNNVCGRDTSQTTGTISLTLIRALKPNFAP